MASDYIIIIPTHSSYQKTVENFLQLLRKNWPNCPYKLIVSVTGNNTVIPNCENLYNGRDASLIDCIVNVTKKYPNKRYLCLLGDAFINKKIDNEIVQKMLNILTKNRIDYCSLNYVRNYKKVKTFNQNLRYIHGKDRYSHSFVAFAASYQYIAEELSKFKSDLDFEKFYLFQDKNEYYKNHLIVRKNYFNLLPSITKGKWDRNNYYKLRKSNPEVIFDKREVQTLKEAFVCHLRELIVPCLPSKMRIRVKKIVENISGFHFGVKD